MIKEGDIAPDFTLPDQDGKEHTLSDYRGQWVLIYFYPKDNTPGCTTEACQIRDDFPAFADLNAQVFGISADSVASHKKFADAYNLPFTLLADTERTVLMAYNVWKEKTMMGKVFMGIQRSSVLIDPKGIVRKVYPSVKADGHAKEVIADLRALTTK